VSFLLEDTAGTVLDVLFIPALLVFGGVISAGKKFFIV
jgi:hypothetical protein